MFFLKICFILYFGLRLHLDQIFAFEEINFKFQQKKNCKKILKDFHHVFKRSEGCSKLSSKRRDKRTKNSHIINKNNH